ncbi:hypothetical protein KXV85_005806, partial [Aspergillus fumigatus]
QSGRRRPQEPRIPHRRGSAHLDGFPRRLHGGRYQRAAFGDHLHHRALDHRRRPYGDDRRIANHDPRLPRRRRHALRRHRLGRDHGDRPPLRGDLRGEKPGRGRPALYADPRARERREHRAARRRAGGTRGHRPQFLQRAEAMGAPRRPAHAHHAGLAGLQPHCS